MNTMKTEEVKRKKKISKGMSLCGYATFSRFNK